MSYFLTLAKKRKTTYEFSSRPVPASLIPSLLEAATWAPSCVNSQPWHFVVIKNKAKIAQVMKTGNYGFFHETNPSLIIALVLLQNKCSGPNHACFRSKTTSTYDSHISVGMATLNICYEARALGVSSAIITPKQREIKKILQISSLDSVPLFVCLGYEKVAAFQKVRTRTPWQKCTSYERFNATSQR